MEELAGSSGLPESTFCNTEPRTREERLVAQSRERLEKKNLLSKRGCFHRYEDPGNPVVPDPKSPMYADESDRFKRGVAAEMRQQKVEAARRQQVRSRACARTARHFVHAPAHPVFAPLERPAQPSTIGETK